MNERSRTMERLHQAFAASNDDIGRLVDELLGAAWAHRMKFDWSDGMCEVSELGKDASLERFPVAKSIFLAVLERIAALCLPSSTTATPYAGAGEIDLGQDRRVSVAYFNEPDRQWLCLGPTVDSTTTRSSGPSAAGIAAP